MEREEKDFESVEAMELPELENLSDDDPLDLPPEFCIYTDEGCELAESCLECPFSRCIEEWPFGRSKKARRHRDKEIVRLRAKEKKTAREIASICDVSLRTVHRVLKHYRRKLDE